MGKSNRYNGLTSVCTAGLTETHRMAERGLDGCKQSRSHPMDKKA